MAQRASWRRLQTAAPALHRKIAQHFYDVKNVDMSAAYYMYPEEGHCFRKKENLGATIALERKHSSGLAAIHPVEHRCSTEKIENNVVFCRFLNTQCEGEQQEPSSAATEPSEISACCGLCS